jgi:hypothetical protein
MLWLISWLMLWLMEVLHRSNDKKTIFSKIVFLNGKRKKNGRKLETKTGTGARTRMGAGRGSGAGTGNVFDPSNAGYPLLVYLYEGQIMRVCVRVCPL